MKRTGFILILITFFSVLSAQENFKISKPDPTFSNNTLIVKYDITGCGSGEFVDISLIILNSKGDTLKPIYISGDLGPRINCGFDKTIVWDLSRESVKIDDDIQILIKGNRSVPVVPPIAIPETNKITRGNILLSSTLVPGLGQKKASGKNAYLAFSGLVYGSLGVACYYNFIRSKQLKEDYLAAYGVEERDDLFNKWEKSYAMTNYFIYGALSAWSINFIWSALMPIKENHLKRMDMSLVSFSKNELLVSVRWTF